MSITIDDLNDRLNNLQQSFIQSQDNQRIITDKADESYKRIPQINDNSQGVYDNSNDILVTQEGLAETYEEMNTSIIEVEEALTEVYEMIIGG